MKSGTWLWDRNPFFQIFPKDFNSQEGPVILL